MTVVSSILSVFTAILEWFVTSLGAIGGIFYTAEAGLTFLGTVTIIGFAIAIVTMVVAMVRSLIKSRG